MKMKKGLARNINILLQELRKKIQLEGLLTK